jgi:hypothetical protein
MEKQFKVKVSVDLTLYAEDEESAAEEALYWVKSASSCDLEVEVEEVEDGE